MKWDKDLTGSHLAIAKTDDTPLRVVAGPGTGKTFAMAKILALLLEQHKEDSLKILLAAPTGKAAARIGESIKDAKKTLNCSVVTPFKNSILLTFRR